MVKSNLFASIKFISVLYMLIISLIYFFNTDILWKYIAILSMVYSGIGLIAYYSSNSIKKIMLENDDYFHKFMMRVTIFLAYLFISLISLFFSTVVLEKIIGINVFNPSDPLMDNIFKLFINGNEMDIGYRFFLLHFIWFFLSFLIYSIGLRIFNAISTIKNNGFNLNDGRIVKVLLKDYTLFVGLIAVMGIGVSFIEYDSFVYNLETDTLYKVVELNYDINRIEKLSAKEYEEFMKTFELEKSNPSLDFFMFSFLFLIPYIHLTYKNK